MTFCSKCWHKNEENRKFCVNCWNSLINNEDQKTVDLANNEIVKKFQNYAENFSKEQKIILYLSLTWIVWIFILFYFLFPSFNSIELKDELIREFLAFWNWFRNKFIFFLVLILFIQFLSLKTKFLKRWMVPVVILFIAAVIPAFTIFWNFFTIFDKIWKEFKQNVYSYDVSNFKNWTWEFFNDIERKIISPFQTAWNLLLSKKIDFEEKLNILKIIYSMIGILPIVIIFFAICDIKNLKNNS